MCCVMLAALLLILATTQACGTEDQCSLYQSESALTTTMRGVAHALECFSQTTREGLRLQTLNNEAVKSLLSLPDMIQKLDERLGDFHRRLEILEEGVKNSNLKVETEDLSACMAPERNPQGIKEVVQSYLRHGNFGQMKRELEGVLDPSGEAATQLRPVSVFYMGSNGCTQLAKLLFCGGLPVDTVEEVNNTMLQGAALGGHLQLVSMLLALGADVNTRNNLGWTPLMRAVERNSLEVVQRLVQAGADTTLKCSSGITALQWARPSSPVAQYLSQLPH